MRARNLTETQMSDGICPLDGTLIRDHDRCYGCGILAGEKHCEKRLYLYGDKVYCSDCIKRHKHCNINDGVI